MTPFGRALLGAAVGSLVVLSFHPISRPFVRAAISPPRDLHETLRHAYEGGVDTRLPTPTSLDDASLWVQVGTTRSPDGEGGKRVRESLYRVVQAAAEHEPENAYWRQMAAVFARDLGRQTEATAWWRLGAECLTWNDYQSARLGELRERLSGLCGANMAWQWAWVYNQRDLRPARLIESFGRGHFATLDPLSPKALEARVASASNAFLMLRGSRSIAVGDIAASLADAVATAPESPITATRRRLYTAKIELRDDVSRHLGDAAADRIDRGYREQDAFVGYTSTAPDDSLPLGLMLGALATGIGPSIAAIIAFTGAGLVAIGLLFRLRVPKPALYMGLIGAGLLAGVLLTPRLEMPWAGPLFGAAIAFQCLSPRKDLRDLSHYGSLFGFAALLFATILTILLAFHFTAQSFSGSLMLEVLGVPAEYGGGSQTMLSVALIVGSLILAVPPIWAFSQSTPTPRVLEGLLRRIGTVMFVVGIIAAVAGTPIAILADRQLDTTLSKLVQNEPLYYLQQ